MVKGVINAFDHMELCFVINLTKDGKWAITRPPIFATRYVNFASTLQRRYNAGEGSHKIEPRYK